MCDKIQRLCKFDALLVELFIQREVSGETIKIEHLVKTTQQNGMHDVLRYISGVLWVEFFKYCEGGGEYFRMMNKERSNLIDLELGFETSCILLSFSH